MKYRCSECKKIVERASKKMWVKSYCEAVSSSPSTVTVFATSSTGTLRDERFIYNGSGPKPVLPKMGGASEGTTLRPISSRSCFPGIDNS